MTMRRSFGLLLFAIFFGMSVGVESASADVTAEWRFKVLLEGDPIGHQTFRLTQDGSRQRVSIEASMDVKILFLTVYSYRHRNDETWEDGCLVSIASETDDNGEPFRIRGAREGDAFVIDDGKARSLLPSCVHSFAYWDPEKLRQSSLLNSQTGKYEAVQLRELGEETLPSGGGGQQRARRFALEGPELRIDLWYSSADNDWLALESRSKSGRVIRYVRE